jgi:heptosyltransferase-2
MGKRKNNGIAKLKKMPKFLIIQTAFIGDVVLATGLVEKLHQHFPSAQIDFLVRKGNEALLKDHPKLNEVLVWNKQQHKYRNWWRTLKQVRANKYDTVINVQRFPATGLLTAFSGAKEKIGFNKNPFSWLFTKKVKHVISSTKNQLHEIARNNELVQHLTGSLVNKPRLYPSAEDEKRIAPYIKAPMITISPASVWFTKQYPADKWLKFIDHLTHDHTIYLLGAAGDKVLAEQIKKGSSHPGIQVLCGQLSFLQSAALMQHAIMNYVNDSAPMHFASAVNAPVTAVYCSTLPSFGFGPLSDVSFIVEKEEPLYCRPCGLHGRKECPEGHFKCAYDIREEQLLNSIGSNR